MITTAKLRRIATIVLLTTVIAGCADIKEFLAPRPKAPSAQAAIDKPQLEPLSRNRFELTSPDQSLIGEPQLVFTKAEHTFSDLAREYGLGYDELVEANPDVDPWLPGENTPVLLPTQYLLPDVPRQGLVLNIASKRLFYFPEAEEGEVSTVMTYPIGIGRVGWETPLGEATIIAKARDPHWYVPASVRKEHAEQGDPLPAVVPPGPDNPLGHFVLKLDMPGYLIHGTNQPYGVGMRVSHGCIRLYPENIELLYELAGIGEQVRIINEPYIAGWQDGELYLESHTPLEDDTVNADDRLQKIFDYARNQSGAFIEEDEREQALVVVGDARGVPVRVLQTNTLEVFDRVRVIRNTVELDPDAPTLEEVRVLLDTPLDEEIAVDANPDDE